MKKCPYCGRENSDDAYVCVIDQTPLGEMPVTVKNEKEPSRFNIHFAWVSEEKIPVSLTVLSYLYFLPAAVSWVALTCLGLACAGFLLFSQGGLEQHALDFEFFSTIVTGAALALFFTALSRGLRRGSRGWRTCTLIIIVIYFFVGLWGVGKEIFTYVSKQPHLKHGAAPLDFWSVHVLGTLLWFLILWWQYHVLTRPAVREHFGIY